MTSRICIALHLFAALTINAATHHIDPAVTTLQQAIDAATAHDSLILGPGSFQETGILLSKALTILSVNETVIDGGGEGEILNVKADSVHLEGLIFKGSGLSYIDDNAAVKFDNAHDGSIRNCQLEDNFFGIYLARSENILLEGNRVRSNAKTESKSGNGIHLWYCKSIQIRNNTVSGHRDGIYLEFVEECSIEGNLSTANLRYGLHFMFSNHNSYRQNRFTENGAGVAVMYSRHVDMEENEFRDNWGDASYGLLLKDIYDSRVENNLFEENTIAVYAEASNRVMIQNNHFNRNGYAMRIMANCMDNEITSNSFVDNSFEIATNSVQNFNHYADNYWSSYEGYDMDGDGIGDVPHRPVRMFSILTEKNGAALILLRSNFVTLLDMAERYLPVFTPQTLLDESPRMQVLN